MVEDSDVAKEYLKIDSHFSEGLEGKLVSPFDAQIFAGMKRLSEDSHPAGCARHFLLFRTHDVIPEFCFDCYKVQIQPKNVIDLFKLALLFKAAGLPRNNARKCFLRPRKDVAAHYSGSIYFKGVNEARSVLNDIEPALRANLGEDVSIIIKRGCTEYALKYPAYAELTRDHEPLLQTNDDWKRIEAKFDEGGAADELETIPDEPYPSGFNVRDYLSMQTWLSYAKTIGDESYKKITDKPVDVIPDLDPAPFDPA